NHEQRPSAASAIVHTLEETTAAAASAREAVAQAEAMYTLELREAATDADRASIELRRDADGGLAAAKAALSQAEDNLARFRAALGTPLQSQSPRPSDAGSMFLSSNSLVRPAGADAVQRLQKLQAAAAQHRVSLHAIEDSHVQAASDDDRSRLAEELKEAKRKLSVVERELRSAFAKPSPERDVVAKLQTLQAESDTARELVQGAEARYAARMAAAGDSAEKDVIARERERDPQLRSLRVQLDEVEQAFHAALSTPHSKRTSIEKAPDRALDRLQLLRERRESLTSVAGSAESAEDLHVAEADFRDGLLAVGMSGGPGDGVHVELLQWLQGLVEDSKAKEAAALAGAPPGAAVPARRERVRAEADLNFFLRAGPRRASVINQLQALHTAAERAKEDIEGLETGYRRELSAARDDDEKAEVLRRRISDEDLNAAHEALASAENDFREVLVGSTSKRSASLAKSKAGHSSASVPWEEQRENLQLVINTAKADLRRLDLLAESSAAENIELFGHDARTAKEQALRAKTADPRWTASVDAVIAADKALTGHRLTTRRALAAAPFASLESTMATDAEATVVVRLREAQIRSDLAREKYERMQALQQEELASVRTDAERSEAFDLMRSDEAWLEAGAQLHQAESELSEARLALKTACRQEAATKARFDTETALVRALGHIEGALSLAEEGPGEGEDPLVQLEPGEVFELLEAELAVLQEADPAAAPRLEAVLASVRRAQEVGGTAAAPLLLEAREELIACRAAPSEPQPFGQPEFECTTPTEAERLRDARRQTAELVAPYHRAVRGALTVGSVENILRAKARDTQLQAASSALEALEAAERAKAASSTANSSEAALLCITDAGTDEVGDRELVEKLEARQRQLDSARDAVDELETAYEARAAAAGDEHLRAEIARERAADPLLKESRIAMRIAGNELERARETLRCMSARCDSSLPESTVIARMETAQRSVDYVRGKVGRLEGRYETLLLQAGDAAEKRAIEAQMNANPELKQARVALRGAEGELQAFSGALAVGGSVSSHLPDGTVVYRLEAAQNATERAKADLRALEARYEAQLSMRATEEEGTEILEKMAADVQLEEARMNLVVAEDELSRLRAEVGPYFSDDSTTYQLASMMNNAVIQKVQQAHEVAERKKAHVEALEAQFDVRMGAAESEEEKSAITKLYDVQHTNAIAAYDEAEAELTELVAAIRGEMWSPGVADANAVVLRLQTAFVRVAQAKADHENLAETFESDMRAAPTEARREAVSRRLRAAEARWKAAEAELQEYRTVLAIPLAPAAGEPAAPALAEQRALDAIPASTVVLKLKAAQNRANTARRRFNSARRKYDSALASAASPDERREVEERIEADGELQAARTELLAKESELREFASALRMNAADGGAHDARLGELDNPDDQWVYQQLREVRLRADTARNELEHVEGRYLTLFEEAVGFDEKKSVERLKADDPSWREASLACQKREAELRQFCSLLRLGTGADASPPSSLQDLDQTLVHKLHAALRRCEDAQASLATAEAQFSGSVSNNNSNDETTPANSRAVEAELAEKRAEVHRSRRALHAFRSALVVEPAPSESPYSEVVSPAFSKASNQSARRGFRAHSSHLGGGGNYQRDTSQQGLYGRRDESDLMRVASALEEALELNMTHARTDSMATDAGFDSTRMRLQMLAEELLVRTEGSNVDRVASLLHEALLETKGAYSAGGVSPSSVPGAYSAGWADGSGVYRNHSEGNVQRTATLEHLRNALVSAEVVLEDAKGGSDKDGSEAKMRAVEHLKQAVRDALSSDEAGTRSSVVTAKEKIDRTTSDISLSRDHSRTHLTASQAEATAKLKHVRELHCALRQKEEDLEQYKLPAASESTGKSRDKEDSEHENEGWIPEGESSFMLKKKQDEVAKLREELNFAIEALNVDESDVIESLAASLIDHSALEAKERDVARLTRALREAEERLQSSDALRTAEVTRLRNELEEAKRSGKNWPTGSTKSKTEKIADLPPIIAGSEEDERERSRGSGASEKKMKEADDEWVRSVKGSASPSQHGSPCSFLVSIADARRHVEGLRERIKEEEESAEADEGAEPSGPPNDEEQMAAGAAYRAGGVAKLRDELNEALAFLNATATNFSDTIKFQVPAESLASTEIDRLERVLSELQPAPGAPRPSVAKRAEIKRIEHLLASLKGTHQAVQSQSTASQRAEVEKLKAFAIDLECELDASLSGALDKEEREMELSCLRSIIDTVEHTLEASLSESEKRRDVEKRERAREIEHLKNMVRCLETDALKVKRVEDKGRRMSEIIGLKSVISRMEDGLEGTLASASLKTAPAPSETPLVTPDLQQAVVLKAMRASSAQDLIAAEVDRLSLSIARQSESLARSKSAPSLSFPGHAEIEAEADRVEISRVQDLLGVYASWLQRGGDTRARTLARVAEAVRFVQDEAEGSEAETELANLRAVERDLAESTKGRDATNEEIRRLTDVVRDLERQDDSVSPRKAQEKAEEVEQLRIKIRALEDTAAGGGNGSSNNNNSNAYTSASALLHGHSSSNNAPQELLLASQRPPLGHGGLQAECQRLRLRAARLECAGGAAAEAQRLRALVDLLEGGPPEKEASDLARACDSLLTAHFPDDAGAGGEEAAALSAIAAALRAEMARAERKAPVVRARAELHALRETCEDAAAAGSADVAALEGLLAGKEREFADEANRWIAENDLALKEARRALSAATPEADPAQLVGEVVGAMRLADDVVDAKCAVLAEKRAASDRRSPAGGGGGALDDEAASLAREVRAEADELRSELRSLRAVHATLQDRDTNSFAPPPAGEAQALAPQRAVRGLIADRCARLAVLEAHEVAYRTGEARRLQSSVRSLHLKAEALQAELRSPRLTEPERCLVQSDLWDTQTGRRRVAERLLEARFAMVSAAEAFVSDSKTELFELRRTASDVECHGTNSGFHAAKLVEARSRVACKEATLSGTRRMLMEERVAIIAALESTVTRLEAEVDVVNLELTNPGLTSSRRGESEQQLQAARFNLVEQRECLSQQKRRLLAEREEDAAQTAADVTRLRNRVLSLESLLEASMASSVRDGRVLQLETVQTALDEKRTALAEQKRILLIEHEQTVLRQEAEVDDLKAVVLSLENQMEESMASTLREAKASELEKVQTVLQEKQHSLVEQKKTLLREHEENVTQHKAEIEQLKAVVVSLEDQMEESMASTLRNAKESELEKVQAVLQEKEHALVEQKQTLLKEHEDNVTQHKAEVEQLKAVVLSLENQMEESMASTLREAKESEMEKVQAVLQEKEHALVEQKQALLKVHEENVTQHKAEVEQLKALVLSLENQMEESMASTLREAKESELEKVQAVLHEKEHALVEQKKVLLIEHEENVTQHKTEIEQLKSLVLSLEDQMEESLASTLRVAKESELEKVQAVLQEKEASLAEQKKVLLIEHEENVTQHKTEIEQLKSLVLSLEDQMEESLASTLRVAKESELEKVQAVLQEKEASLAEQKKVLLIEHEENVTQHKTEIEQLKSLVLSLEDQMEESLASTLRVAKESELEKVQAVLQEKEASLAEQKKVLLIEHEENVTQHKTEIEQLKSLVLSLEDQMEESLASTLRVAKESELEKVQAVLQEKEASLAEQKKVLLIEHEENVTQHKTEIDRLNALVLSLEDQMEESLASTLRVAKESELEKVQAVLQEKEASLAEQKKVLLIEHEENVTQHKTEIEQLKSLVLSLEDQMEESLASTLRVAKESELEKVQAVLQEKETALAAQKQQLLEEREEAIAAHKAEVDQLKAVVQGLEDQMEESLASTLRFAKESELEKVQAVLHEKEAALADQKKALLAEHDESATQHKAEIDRLNALVLSLENQMEESLASTLRSAKESELERVKAVLQEKEAALALQAGDLRQEMTDALAQKEAEIESMRAALQDLEDKMEESMAMSVRAARETSADELRAALQKREDELLEERRRLLEEREREKNGEITKLNEAFESAMKHRLAAEEELATQADELDKNRADLRNKDASTKHLKDEINQLKDEIVDLKRLLEEKDALLAVAGETIEATQQHETELAAEIGCKEEESEKLTKVMRTALGQRKLAGGESLRGLVKKIKGEIRVFLSAERELHGWGRGGDSALMDELEASCRDDSKDTPQAVLEKLGRVFRAQTKGMRSALNLVYEKQNAIDKLSSLLRDAGGSIIDGLGDTYSNTVNTDRANSTWATHQTTRSRIQALCEENSTLNDVLGGTFVGHRTQYASSMRATTSATVLPPLPQNPSHSTPATPSDSDMDADSQSDVDLDEIARLERLIKRKTRELNADKAESEELLLALEDASEFDVTNPSGLAECEHQIQGLELRLKEKEESLSLATLDLRSGSDRDRDPSEIATTVKLVQIREREVTTLKTEIQRATVSLQELTSAKTHLDGLAAGISDKEAELHQLKLELHLLKETRLLDAPAGGPAQTDELQGMLDQTLSRLQAKETEAQKIQAQLLAAREASSAAETEREDTQLELAGTKKKLNSTVKVTDAIKRENTDLEDLLQAAEERVGVLEKQVFGLKRAESDSKRAVEILKEELACKKGSVDALEQEKDELAAALAGSEERERDAAKRARRLDGERQAAADALALLEEEAASAAEARKRLQTELAAKARALDEAAARGEEAEDQLQASSTREARLAAKIQHLQAALAAAEADLAEAQDAAQKEAATSSLLERTLQKEKTERQHQAPPGDSAPVAELSRKVQRLEEAQASLSDELAEAKDALAKRTSEWKEAKRGLKNAEAELLEKEDSFEDEKRRSKALELKAKRAHETIDRLEDELATVEQGFAERESELKKLHTAQADLHVARTRVRELEATQSEPSDPDLAQRLQEAKAKCDTAHAGLQAALQDLDGLKAKFPALLLAVRSSQADVNSMASAVSALAANSNILATIAPRPHAVENSPSQTPFATPTHKSFPYLSIVTDGLDTPQTTLPPELIAAITDLKESASNGSQQAQALSINLRSHFEHLAQKHEEVTGSASDLHKQVSQLQHTKTELVVKTESLVESVREHKEKSKALAEELSEVTLEAESAKRKVESLKEQLRQSQADADDLATQLTRARGEARKAKLELEAADHAEPEDGAKVARLQKKVDELTEELAAAADEARDKARKLQQELSDAEEAADDGKRREASLHRRLEEAEHDSDRALKLKDVRFEELEEAYRKRAGETAALKASNDKLSADLLALQQQLDGRGDISATLEKKLEQRVKKLEEELAIVAEAGSEAESEARRAEQRCAALQQDLDFATEQQKKLHSDRKTLREQLTAAEDAAAEAQRELSDLRLQLDRAEAMVKEAKKREASMSPARQLALDDASSISTAEFDAAVRRAQEAKAEVKVLAHHSEALEREVAESELFRDEERARASLQHRADADFWKSVVQLEMAHREVAQELRDELEHAQSILRGVATEVAKQSIAVRAFESVEHPDNLTPVPHAHDPATHRTSPWSVRGWGDGEVTPGAQKWRSVSPGGRLGNNLFFGTPSLRAVTDQFVKLPQHVAAMVGHLLAVLDAEKEALQLASGKAEHLQTECKRLSSESETVLRLTSEVDRLQVELLQKEEEVGASKRSLISAQNDLGRADADAREQSAEEEQRIRRLETREHELTAQVRRSGDWIKELEEKLAEAKRDVTRAQAKADLEVQEQNERLAQLTAELKLSRSTEYETQHTLTITVRQLEAAEKKVASHNNLVRDYDAVVAQMKTSLDEAASQTQYLEELLEDKEEEMFAMQDELVAAREELQTHQGLCNQLTEQARLMQGFVQKKVMDDQYLEKELTHHPTTAHNTITAHNTFTSLNHNLSLSAHSTPRTVSSQQPPGTAPPLNLNSGFQSLSHR
ncbi:Polyubiquitin, partial [Diplonema papillatum]